MKSHLSPDGKHRRKRHRIRYDRHRRAEDSKPEARMGVHVFQVLAHLLIRREHSCVYIPKEVPQKQNRASADDMADARFLPSRIHTVSFLFSSVCTIPTVPF